MKIDIQPRGERVFINIDDRTYLELEPRSALEFAAALQIAGLRAQEQEQAERIAYDTAILTRAGAPFGLTNDPRIQAEAAKITAWDRDLRRFMPGIQSEAVLGLPTLVPMPPVTKGQTHG